MLSIDEAIAHAREVAEEQRELFRLCPYPSQECNGADICKCLKNKHDGCIKCAEEHEQLAEWLEELKQLREQTTWIPCSEKLPELRKDVIVTVRYTGFMGMHGCWIKTGHMEAENDWWRDCAGGEVIAWMPLPQPYNAKRSDGE